MYSRIMLTTDGSHLAHAAVEHAVPLALATQATVVLLEAIEGPEDIYGRASAAGWSPTATGFLSESAVEAMVSKERTAAEHHLDAIESELHRAGVAAVERRIVSGPPGPAIVAAAREERCDVVVMATHGRSGLARVLIGSVADYVARHASCPVLLVPPPHRR